MRFNINTKGSCDIINITDRVSSVVQTSKAKDGICLVSCPGSTCGITTIEYEPNLVADFKEFLGKLVPSNKSYRHNETWGDANGHSHILSSLFKPFLAVPVEDGKLNLGTWQQIVFIDFDNRPRGREIMVKIIKTV